MRNQPAILLILCFISIEAYSQCSTLRQQRNITFNTDKDCAPVSVTDFTITYFFNVPQDPAQISIRFDWNDPANSVDLYGLGDAEFTANGTFTEFTAVGTFTYPENDQCVFLPESTIIVNGESCETSTQTQVVTSWARDNDFGGNIEVAPGVFDVCYGNAVENALFQDNSTFNCNINLEPDNPNRQARYTQFVYGTNHNAGLSIRNLSLVDGGGSTVNLTDNAANLSSPQTIGGVTATYFGDIMEIPFPADGPQLISLPISAPADASNAVGNSFEITLYNWNICNPFNGDYASPNYSDAVATTAYITIVDPPVPDFLTRLNSASGVVKSVFCLGETIYFDNETTGANQYRWEFFDDDTGSSLIHSSTATNPSYVYSTPGDKLIRLYADDSGAEGDCEVVIEKLITLSPAAVAQIGLFDDTFSSTITPEFCLENGTVTVGFRDETYDIEPETEWRWEFYNEDGDLIYSIPAGTNTYGPAVTDFTRTFSSKGEHLVRLIARNNTSQCESVAEETIYIYDMPEATYEYTEVCEGERTVFYNIPDDAAALYPQVNADSIIYYEWDFSYDGTFNSELTHSDHDAFEFYLNGNDLVGGAEPESSTAGTYTVALQMTSAKGHCTALFTRQVTVNPLPSPLLSSDYVAPICPGENLRFYNNSDLEAADYLLFVTDSSAYNDTLDFNNPDTVYAFHNTADSSRVFYVGLLGTTDKGCREVSSIISVEVLPAFQSGFRDVNYSVVSGNCSVWESTLIVNDATKSLNADEYVWTIADDNGPLSGFPISNYKGEPDFHQLDYSIINSSGVNQVYTVTLEVLKANACVSPSQETYLINPQPEGDFLIEEAEECTYKTIRLSAVQNGLTTYSWDISPTPDQRLDEGDRQTLFYHRPHPDSSFLNVNVSLFTENLAGCVSDTVNRTFTIDQLQEPLKAYFEINSDTLVLPNNELQVINHSSSGAIYSWDFGNGDTSSVYDPEAIYYQEPGIYEIFMRVSNTFCEETFKRSVVVLPANPIIEFSADRLEGCAALTVNFINESAYAESGSYYWEFGDGKFSSADQPSHTYARAGIYTVTLYGENKLGNGSVAIKEDYIEVYEQPIANFALTPSIVFVPDNPVYFRNSSVNASSFQWNFGDGYSSDQRDPVHYYESEGNYSIELIARTDHGCADTLYKPSVVKAILGGDAKTPNAFSPSKSGPGSTNGAGETINDVFIPKVEGVRKFRMLIYNKWGQLLFESLSKDVGWDGYFNGVLQPSDVYVYKLELIYSDGREAVKVGDVTLVR